MQLRLVGKDKHFPGTEECVYASASFADITAIKAGTPEAGQALDKPAGDGRRP